MKKERGTVRSSAIFIASASDDKIGVYHSIDEIPLPLRKKVVESTMGLNSTTILIADQRGRDELARAVRGLPARVPARLVELLTANQEASQARVRSWSLTRRFWLEALLLSGVGFLAWLLFVR